MSKIPGDDDSSVSLLGWYGEIKSWLALSEAEPGARAALALVGDSSEAPSSEEESGEEEEEEESDIEY